MIAKFLSCRKLKLAPHSIFRIFWFPKTVVPRNHPGLFPFKQSKIFEVILPRLIRVMMGGTALVGGVLGLLGLE